MRYLVMFGGSLIIYVICRLISYKLDDIKDGLFSNFLTGLCVILYVVSLPAFLILYPVDYLYQKRQAERNQSELRVQYLALTQKHHTELESANRIHEYDLQLIRSLQAQLTELRTQSPKAIYDQGYDVGHLQGLSEGILLSGAWTEEEIIEANRYLNRIYEEEQNDSDTN